MLIPRATIPRQFNDFDCGVFLCMYADYLSEGSPLRFSQADMPLFRRRLILAIIKAGRFEATQEDDEYASSVNIIED